MRQRHELFVTMCSTHFSILNLFVLAYRPLCRWQLSLRKTRWFWIPRTSDKSITDDHHPLPTSNCTQKARWTSILAQQTSVKVLHCSTRPNASGRWLRTYFWGMHTAQFEFNGISGTLSCQHQFQLLKVSLIMLFYPLSCNHFFFSLTYQNHSDHL